MTEEKFLKYKENSGFKVPDGYFDGLTERIMGNLPQQKKPTRLQLVRKVWRYAAAIVVCAGVGYATYYTSNNNMQIAEQDTEYDYINDALDYAMVDNMQIAEYLTEAE